MGRHTLYKVILRHAMLSEIEEHLEKPYGNIEFPGKSSPKLVEDV
jgi:hypothetical protein